MTAIAVQPSGRLAASLDAAGAAMVWRAADLMPLASVPAAAHQSGPQCSVPATQPTAGGGAKPLPKRAIAWLPAPDAAVVSLPRGGGANASKGAEGQTALLLLADPERMRVLRVPASPAVGPAAETTEVAVAAMPDGCEGICKLTVPSGLSGRAEQDASSAVSAMVFGLAQMAAGGEVACTWHLTQTDGSHGNTAQLALIDELSIAEVSRQSDVSGAASVLPPGPGAGFATLLSHDTAQLATADPGAGVISLYSLRNAAEASSQRRLSADSAEARQVQLIATAPLSDGARVNNSGTAQRQRPAKGDAASLRVVDVALSASARQLAAVGTKGAREARHKRPRCTSGFGSHTLKHRMPAKGETFRCC